MDGGSHSPGKRRRADLAAPQRQFGGRLHGPSRVVFFFLD